MNYIYTQENGSTASYGADLAAELVTGLGELPADRNPIGISCRP